MDAEKVKAFVERTICSAEGMSGPELKIALARVVAAVVCNFARDPEDVADMLDGFHRTVAESVNAGWPVILQMRSDLAAAAGAPPMAERH